MSQAKYDKMSSSEQINENWMNTKWRPFMALTYMITCIFDFIIGPIFFNIMQFYTEGQHIEMWKPLTLEGSGLYHLAMGAILGIAAYGRTQEKLMNASNRQNSYYQPSTYDMPYDSGYYQTRYPSKNKYGSVVPQPEDPIL